MQQAALNALGGGWMQGTKHKNLRIYNFRSPDKFSKEQLRTMILLHENFGRAVTTALSALLRTTAQVTPTTAEQSSYQDFVRGLADPTVLGIVTLAPLPGNALLEVPPEIAFPMIDRLLGGPGQGVVKGRSITDIEATVLRRVVHTIMESMVEAWRNVSDVTPRLEAIETNPLFAQVVSPAEMVANIFFNVQIGSHGGDMKLCLPHTLLASVLPQLSSSHWLVRDKGRPKENVTDKIRRELDEVPLVMSAEMGRTHITVGELLALDVGDIVQLDSRVGAPVALLVKGRRKFLGQPGKVGRRLAVQVFQAVQEGE